MTSATCRRRWRPRRRRSDRRGRACRAVAGGGAGRAATRAGAWRRRRAGPGDRRDPRGRGGAGALSLLAFAALVCLFLRTDLRVLLVAENSHADKPWLYKFAGTWGNHEGSMLLWVTVLAIAGAVVALFERHLDEPSLGRDACRAGGAGAGLLRVPVVRVQSVRAAQPGAGRGARAQPLAAGSRPRLPPADALPRLCRPVGGVQPRRRRAGHAPGRPGAGPRDAAVGARRRGCC